MRITPGDFNDPRVVDLVRLHLTSARAQTAPGSAHALDISALQCPDIGFWTIWDDETLLGIGALKRLAADHGEVQVDAYRAVDAQRGAGSAILRHIRRHAPAACRA